MLRGRRIERNEHLSLSEPSTRYHGNFSSLAIPNCLTMHFSLEALKTLSKRLAPRLGPAPAIGLYLGKSAVNLVQMEQTASGARIRAMAALPLEGAREALAERPREFKALLQSAFKAYPFVGKRVVSSLSSKDVKISTMSFRRQPGQSDDEALVVALRERMPDELDDTVVDFMSLRPAESEAEQGEALVALASRTKVTEYLDQLTAIGLEAVALDVGPNALSRLVRHSGAQHWREFPKLPNALLINVGLNASFLSVIWGRRLILDRQVSFSEGALVSRLQKVLEMPEALALHLLHELESSGNAAESQSTVLELLRPEMAVLLQEINKTLVYMASKTRGKSVDVIYLAGSAARYPSLLNGFQSQLQVPVVPLEPVSLFAHDARIRPQLGLRPGIVLATGLALREVRELG